MSIDGIFQVEGPIFESGGFGYGHGVGRVFPAHIGDGGNGAFLKTGYGDIGSDCVFGDCLRWEDVACKSEGNVPRASHEGWVDLCRGWNVEDGIFESGWISLR